MARSYLKASDRPLDTDGFWFSVVKEVRCYMEGSVNSFFISQCARTTSGARCSAS